MKPRANPLRPGLVIRTQPRAGYWGCVVVLTARDSTKELDPACHLATAVLIRREKYEWSSVEPHELAIVTWRSNVRVGPNDYRLDPRVRTSIGIYTVRSADGLDIVGDVDPLAIHPHPLTFDVGDGTAGKYPLCGPIKPSLGSEAVVAWRALHEPELMERENVESRADFEAYEAKRLAEARAKRQARRKQT